MHFSYHHQLISANLHMKFEICMRKPLCEFSRIGVLISSLAEISLLTAFAKTKDDPQKAEDQRISWSHDQRVVPCQKTSTVKRC